MKETRAWIWSTALLLCATIAASYATIFYYSQAESYRRSYESLQSELENLTIQVSLKIDYGNGTVRWLNDTRVPLDSSLLTATKIAARVEYSVSDLGAFVTKINDIGGAPNRFWLWSYFDRDKGDWVFGPVGSDKWTMHDKDVVAWTYTAL